MERGGSKERASERDHIQAQRLLIGEVGGLDGSGESHSRGGWWGEGGGVAESVENKDRVSQKKTMYRRRQNERSKGTG
jgi:hypothetical protein